MSKTAAQSFINAAKTSIKKFDDETGEYYKKFVAGKETPDQDDVKALAKIIKEGEELAAFYHDDVKKAIQMFGGPSDTKLFGAKTLLQTVMKKAKK